jgi:hypothetical protein
VATFNKFNIFVQDVGRKVHNLNTDQLKIMLTNVAPVATNAVDGDMTEISAANGYSAGGNAVGSNAYSQSSGTAKLTGNAVTFTASGGSFGPFRYAVLYNATAGSASNRPLIGWYDYASSISLNDGESFKAAKDTSGNNWDSTTPLISVT